MSEPMSPMTTARHSEADLEEEQDEVEVEAMRVRPRLKSMPACLPSARGRNKGMRLLLVRHGQSANKVKAPGEKREADPRLSELGFEQAEAVGRRLASDLLGEEDNLLVASSPMRRCLLTARPLIRELALERQRCICHFGAFEYSCAGMNLKGSSKSEVEAEFPEFQASGFNDQGTWDCRSNHDKETQEECALRGERLIEWVRLQALQGVGVLVLANHRTFCNLLCHILKEGTAKGWDMEDDRSNKLSNAAFTEILLDPDDHSTFRRENVRSHLRR